MVARSLGRKRVVAAPELHQRGPPASWSHAPWAGKGLLLPQSCISEAHLRQGQAFTSRSHACQGLPQVCTGKPHLRGNKTQAERVPNLLTWLVREPTPWHFRFCVTASHHAPTGQAGQGGLSMNWAWTRFAVNARALDQFFGRLLVCSLCERRWKDEQVGGTREYGMRFLCGEKQHNDLATLFLSSTHHTIVRLFSMGRLASVRGF